MNSIAKVMIVDTDASVRDTCIAVAERLGSSVYTTAYIDDFSLLVPQFLPDVVILDVKMLRRGGSHLLNFLSDCLLPMQIILMSEAGDRADALAESLLRSTAIDTVSVIHKPTDQMLLARRLEIRLKSLSGERDSDDSDQPGTTIHPVDLDRAAL